MIWKMSFMKKRILKKLVSENFVSAKARVSSDYVAAKFSLLTDIEAKFYNFEGIFLHISLGTIGVLFHHGHHHHHRNYHVTLPWHSCLEPRGTAEVLPKSLHL